MAVPKIRFKGFSGEWERRKFNNIVNRISSQSDSDSLPKIEFEDIISGEGRLNKDISKKLDKRKGIIFEPGNILYGKLRPYLKNWLFADFKGIALGDFWVFETNNSSSIFVYYLVQGENFQEVANLSTGTKMPRSDWKIVSETNFQISLNNSEQTAIGNFFRTLDDIIALYKRKLDGLKELKKGYMQYIFPQAGESVPRVRFAGFSGEWEEKLLGDVSDIKTGSKDVQDSIESGEYPFFIRSDDVKRINSYSYNGEAILIPGEGRLGDIFHYINGKFDFHQRVYKISDFKEVGGLYLYQYLRAHFKRHAMTFTVKATVDSLRLPMLTNFKMFVPSLPEQTAIGNLFHTLDEQITAQQSKLDKLKQLKTAYLQKMFV